MFRLMFRTAGACVALALALQLGTAQQISHDNPDERAKQAEQAAAQNSKQAAEAIMAAIGTEYDGPAGFKMAEAVGKLTSEEALEVVEKRLLSFTRPENLFGAYWSMIGLARQKTERADAIIAKAISESKDKEFLLRAAAIEALAFTKRSDKTQLLIETLDRLDPKKLEGDEVILTLSCIQGAPKLVAEGDKELRNKVVLKLADVLEQTSDDRIQYFICTSLSEITGEDKYTSPKFWRWWVEAGGIKVDRGEDEGPTVAGRDVPKFFKAAAVGKRVVFVIDISGSMQHPVNIKQERQPPKDPPKDDGPVTGDRKGDKGKDGEEKKPEIPPPDYSKVRIKLDLAKVELIHTLTHLPEDYFFNIVIYDTHHSMIDSVDEFVQATDGNKRKFIKKVEGLNFRELTNIHGALNRAFCINQTKSIDPLKVNKKGNSPNPAWDPECLRTGATTIFFLTDGSPTYSDDTTNPPQRRVPAGQQPQQYEGANGRMVHPQNIVWDVLRLNTFRKVVINTVGIGPHDGRLMSILAQMSGGEYVDRSGAASRGD